MGGGRKGRAEAAHDSGRLLNSRALAMICLKTWELLLGLWQKSGRPTPSKGGFSLASTWQMKDAGWKITDVLGKYQVIFRAEGGWVVLGLSHTEEKSWKIDRIAIGLYLGAGRARAVTHCGEKREKVSDLLE